MPVSLREHSQKQFSSYLKQIAEVHGLEAEKITQGFAVDPVVQQTLEAIAMENADPFLKTISHASVVEMKGQKVGVGITGRLAKRTDTGKKDRSPRQPVDSQGRNYELHQVEYDNAIKWAIIDSWGAKGAQFNALYRQAIARQMGLDWLTVGWNGSSAATETDITTNTKLEDVAPGWLHQIEQFNSGSQYYEEGSTTDKIRIGANGDFANIDEMVIELKAMLDEPYRSTPGLAVIIGAELLTDRDAKVIAKANDPRQYTAMNAVTVNTVGRLPVYSPPGFPERGLLITNPKNLAIYTQQGTMRRVIQDNHKRDQVDDYISHRIGWVVEQEKATILINPANVKLEEDSDFS